MTQKIIVTVSLFFLLLSSGCVHQLRYKENLFEYQLVPIPVHKRIDKVAGLNLLLDQRPEDELDKCPPDKRLYHNFAQNVTNLLLQDFQKSQLFKEIHWPAQSTDDIVIDGFINRFMWDGRDTFAGRIQKGEGPLGWLAVFCPVVALPFLLGAPLRQEYCMIDISLEVKDNKTGVIITYVKEISKAKQGIISLYGCSSEAGQDVTDAFRQVAEKLKEDLAEKIKDSK